MRILGIETSCDDTGAAIVDGAGSVLANRVSSQTELHRPYGGVVPELASRAHIETVDPLTRLCLDDAGLNLSGVDAVAVTYTPGLAGCLLVGVSYAKALAYALGKPLIGVNHLEAHIYTSALGVAPENHPPFPHLSLLVSGGHTTLYRVDGWTKQTPLGSTRDDAAGEAFDKVAKLLGLGFPGGPAIQKRANGYEGEWIEFTRPMMHHGYDFSFSGLKTAVMNEIRGRTLSEDEITQVTASFQRAAIDVLVTKTLRAARDFGLNHITLVGGVSANTPLREELTRRAAEQGCIAYLPDRKYAMDNGAMIAGLAHHYLAEGKVSSLALNAVA
ncbi:MAG: tRNA (adenosine(37)-N6)-threonylcarbamoyltransferase complex transferase subunit TsaD [bacterium]|nr:tRNA (adenosine(37)-N6)-threonylcarbamoyltransferase complex transferase subunit TsaD [bacterium]